MSRGIFGRILWLHIAFFAVAVLFSELYITSVIHGSYVSDITSELSARINLIENDVSFDGGLRYDGLCRRVKALSGARMTVIADSGEVLGDSDAESLKMENHRDRIEVMRAREAGLGSSIRHSHTLGVDLLYVAKRTAGGGSTPGFIRLAVPLVQVDRAINSIRLKIVLTVLAVLLFTLALSEYFVNLLRRYLKRISEFSHSLAQGATGQQMYFEGAAEFEGITDDLNSMSKRLHEAFAQSESERMRLGVILQSVPDSLLILGARGTIRLASASASEFFHGLPLIGRQYLEVLRNHEVAALVDAAKASGELITEELKVDERYMLVRIAPLRFGLPEGEPDGAVMILHDITKERQLEEVRKDFIANVSHELKTPISAIRGFSETLLGGALDDRENAVSFLETIHSHAERMNSLIDDLMTISRIELGVIRIEKGPVQLDGAIRSVTALLDARAEAKGITLQSSVSPGLAEISADKNRLIQILTNLAENAIKFTDRGSVTIGSEISGGERYIFVRDTGIGVPQKFIPRLGERFFRVDPGRSRKMGGTGLGLSIVKHLVRAHGWHMRVESAEGRGTTVKIII